MVGRLQATTGIGLIISALGLFASSIFLAVKGYIIASLVGATVGSVTIIVGADLLKEA